MNASKQAGLDWIFRCVQCGGEKVLPAGYEPRTPCNARKRDADYGEATICGGNEFRRVGAQSAEPETIRECLGAGDLSVNDARLIG